MKFVEIEIKLIINILQQNKAQRKISSVIFRSGILHLILRAFWNLTYKGIGFLTEIIFREENIRKYIAQVCTEKHTVGLTNKRIYCDITYGNSLE